MCGERTMMRKSAATCSALKPRLHCSVYHSPQIATSMLQTNLLAPGHADLVTRKIRPCQYQTSPAEILPRPRLRFLRGTK